MTKLYFCDPIALEHRTPEGHPERPARIRAIETALEEERFSTLIRMHAPLGSLEQAELCHSARLCETIRQASPESGLIALDADTVMSPATFDAALHAVGAATAAVDEVMTGRATNAFCVMRPPGHHAERERAMGFCFFNSAAIAARHAQKAHGASRVAIFDWDVHHGNGTQDIFWDDDTVLYASTHQMPLFPGTGAPSERGSHGTIVNAALGAGDGSDAFRAAVVTAILPRLDAFAPDLVIISAGFDAHHRDPLGSLKLTEEDFAWATRKLMDVADRHSGGRLVSVLEGGYDLEGLALSTAAHVNALMRG